MLCDFLTTQGIGGAPGIQGTVGERGPKVRFSVSNLRVETKLVETE